MHKDICPCIYIYSIVQRVLELQQIKTFSSTSRMGSLFKVSTLVAQYDESRTLTNDVSDAFAAAFATF